jgi:uridine kinase
VTPRPYIIGIAGPSCSGKTLLAARLAETLGTQHTLVLPLDNYYRDLSHLPLEDRARANFDVPDALDYELFLSHLSALTRGETIHVPVYDFATHSRTGGATIVRPERYIIVEGLLALHWPTVRGLFDLRVYVAAPDTVCLARRAARDVAERGRTPESVADQYARTVRPMAERFVLPSQQFADIIVSGDGPIEEAIAAVLTKRQDAPITSPDLAHS